MANELYKPTAQDISWLAGMLVLIKQDGVLAYPRSQLAYRVDHEHGTLTLITPERAGEPDHAATIEVAKAIGWRVLVPA